MMTFLGWFLLIFFMGSGLVAIPFDLINSFRFRPRPMKEDEFNRHKNTLAKDVEKLLLKGKELLEDKMKADKASGCRGMRERKNVMTRLNKFEANCILAEKEFEKLDNVSQYKNKVEPLKFAIKLIVGIISALFSLLILLHMFLFLLLKVNGKPIHPFFNNFLE